MLSSIILAVIVLISVLLILVVLAQNSKGGVNSQLGGSASQIMGVRKTSDILEKLTWGFAIAVLSLSVVTNVLIAGNKDMEGEEMRENPNIESAKMKASPSLPADQVEEIEGLPTTEDAE